MATTCAQHGCYTVVDRGRCDDHQPDRTQLDAAKNAQPHRRENRRRGATTAAHRTGAVCYLCGHTEQPSAARFDGWHWHHKDPGDPDSEQVLVHGWCNMSFGTGERWGNGVEAVARWRITKLREGKLHG